MFALLPLPHVDLCLEEIAYAAEVLKCDGLKLQTTVDRTQFGITWNNDMPNGEKALANDVTLKAELSLVKQA